MLAFIKQASEANTAPDWSVIGVTVAIFVAIAVVAIGVVALLALGRKGSKAPDDLPDYVKWMVK
ncbi:hypothetical protein [Rhodoluna limnophila]|uniref:hypothetical protein n=1 Tax=Rhodoluna limnophila TaxID=232537 RepID=UPI001106223C|nr:hypothetical protein [Rhodoluna limnophila]